MKVLWLDVSGAPDFQEHWMFPANAYYHTFSIGFGNGQGCQLFCNVFGMPRAGYSLLVRRKCGP